MHPLYRHFENLGKGSASMGEYEMIVGGLENLGSLSVCYQQYHHLLQLIEADSIMKSIYTSNYSSGEAKAYADGVASILNFLRGCHLEVNKKNVADKGNQE